MKPADSPRPLAPDQAAAHQFLTELRTLPYQHGVEAWALGSMWEVFDHARDAMKQNMESNKS